MKLQAFILLLMAIAINAQSQNGQLPPVNFPSGSNVCNTSPYKLVFSDDFDENYLKDPWITFISWNGMKKEIAPGDSIVDDHDNYVNSRWGGNPLNPNSIHKDENVVVSNGTCKLIMKKEPVSWKCDDCPGPPKNLYYTSAALCLPYYKNWAKKSF